MSRILIIGSANADLTVYADRMPLSGETVIGHDFSLNTGGKGANQAAAVAKLGGNVKFIGAVGNDANGKKIIEDLECHGVEFDGICVEKSQTGTATIIVINGENSIIINEGANACVTPQLIEEKADLIKQADYLIMQLEIPVETVIRAAKIAKESNTAVILNPAPCKALPDCLFELTDIIIPNEHEASGLTGICGNSDNELKQKIEFLRKKGVKTVIITLGEKGSIYNISDEIFTCPAEKVRAVDTTCAGDSFIGSLCHKLSEGFELRESIKYATKVAAITVSRMGALASIPFASEIKDI